MFGFTSSLGGRRSRRAILFSSTNPMLHQVESGMLLTSLKEAVKTKLSPKIDHVSLVDLYVYPPKACDSRDRYNPGKKLADLIDELKDIASPASDLYPLIVVAPFHQVVSAQQAQQGDHQHYIHNLNDEQKEHLDAFYSQVMKQCNNQIIGADALSLRLALLFNEGHNHWISKGIPGGYGGLVTAKLVKQDLLKEKGTINQEVAGQRWQQQQPQFRIPPPLPITRHNPPLNSHPDLKPLHVSEVDVMPSRLCRKTLRLLGLSQQGRVDAMRQRIKQGYGMK